MKTPLIFIFLLCASINPAHSAFDLEWSGITSGGVTSDQSARYSLGASIGVLPSRLLDGNSFAIGSPFLTFEFSPPSPTSDRDSDGLPDSFEQQYGLNPDNSADAAEDLDSDGHSNLAEFISGTDPSNRASRLEIASLQPKGNELILTFEAAVDRTYVIEQTAGLGRPFIELTNVTPSPGPVSITLPQGSGNLFIRIAVLPKQ